MKARVLVAAALILSVLGLLTILVPVAPQILYAPVITSYTTSYTTMTPYTVKYVEVVDAPESPPKPNNIVLVVYERVGDSLRISVVYRKWSHIGSRLLVMLSPSGNPAIAVTSSYTVFCPRHCYLYSAEGVIIADLGPPLVIVEKTESVFQNTTYTISSYVSTISVPLHLIGDPARIYPWTWLEYTYWMPYGEESDLLDSAPEFGELFLPDETERTLPEVDLSPNYARTLTQTFQTYSTVIVTNSSAYTVNLSLAASVGAWVPVSILAVAACLFIVAIYVSRKRVRC